MAARWAGELCRNWLWGEFRAYLPRILLTQPWLTRSWREMSQGLTPWWARSTMRWRTTSGRGLPFTKAPPSWFSPPWPKKTIVPGTEVRAREGGWVGIGPEGGHRMCERLQARAHFKPSVLLLYPLLLSASEDGQLLLGRVVYDATEGTWPLGAFWACSVSSQTLKFHSK